MLFQKKGTIKVVVKLHSGLHRGLSIENYDPGIGVEISIKDASSVRFALKSLGMKNISRHAYFINGERAGIFKRLKDGDELSCFRPSAGG